MPSAAPSATYGVTVQGMTALSTETALRAQIKTLLDLGVTKRALAERLDVHESWLGRWLAGAAADVRVRPISVPEMDRFRAYLQQLRDVLGAQPSEGGPQHPPAAETFRPA